MKRLTKLISCLSSAERKRILRRLEVKRGAAADLCRGLLQTGEESAGENLQPGGKTGRSQPHVIRNKAWHILTDLAGEERLHKSDDLRVSKLLQELGMATEAIRLLEKYIPSAMAGEEFLQALEGLSRLMELKQRAGIRILPGTLRLHQQRERICEEGTREHLRVRQDSAQLFFLMRSTGKSGRLQQIRLLQRILRHPYYRSESNIRTFKGGVGFYQLLGAYEALTGNHAKALRWHNSLLKFMERHPEFIRERPLLLLSQANNMANVYASMGRPAEIVTLIARLRSAPSRYGFRESLRWKRDIFVTMYPSLHGVYIDHGLFDRAGSMIRDTEIQLKEFGNEMGPAAMHIMHYNLAVLYFGRKEYHETLGHLNSLLHSPETVRPDLLLSARIIRLLVFYEKKDMDALEYGWINLKRVLGRRTPAMADLYLLFNALVKMKTDRRQMKKKLRNRGKSISGLLFDLKAWIARNV